MIQLKTLGFFFISVAIFSCQITKIQSNDDALALPNTEHSSKVLKGFNQNFSMMPNLTPKMIENIVLLKPQLLRYPGGTVTHSWDWQKGVIETRNTKSIHLLPEIKELSSKTNADFVIVLDILNKSLDNQIEMLTAIEKLGVKIKYIELGNELYAQESEYETVFPTGKEYANRVNLWVPELRRRFPDSKIAALLLGRKVKQSNPKMYTWNRLVVDGTIKNVNAFTYHFYIGENATFASEKEDFNEVTKNANTQNKELWITEYGNNQDKSKASYYEELSNLANYLETFPNVTMALNHQIIGGTKNKLTEDGNNFVEEGYMFLKRAK